ncbi:MAG: hypothetical protein M3Z49_01005 [Bifidobacteriales bacterium]|uniref:hypothetical protein n=1 Tax=Bifidobacterium TaxID=1678 RepID=UPI0018DB7022|nr:MULTISPECIES: hypothetical protein [Bifidobacterium]MBI0145053.1 hypothetical protein [Bifidobacterium polysaccharolyticum]MBI0151876.1 hypothetical protein [Bifidobacterium sp. M0399]MCT6917775.1 hypothetical protein [Bifidobacteriales bacterium]QYN60299.1 hypothetical protein GYM67_03905 [Bifidobacterium asteroides]
MSDKTTYAVVEPQIDEDEQEYPQVHLEALGLKFDLPNLNSKAGLPLEIIQMIFIIKSKVVLSEEEQYQAMAVFLAYFEQIHPTLWNKLRRSDNAMGWLTGIVKAWATESGIDPKALTSSSSTDSTEEH